MDAEARKYDKRIQKLKRELAQVLADKADLKKRLDEQFDENKKLVAKQPELFDFGTQTDTALWKDFVNDAVREQKNKRQPTEVNLPKANVENKSVQVTIVNTRPAHQDQMSDAGLGEQGSNAEQEFIKILIQRANDYEMQYQRIEQEIFEYKRMMQEVGHQQQAVGTHYRGGSNASNMSHNVGYAPLKNPNMSQVIDSQYTSHAQITPINATPHIRTINSPSVDHRATFSE